MLACMVVFVATRKWLEAFHLENLLWLTYSFFNLGIKKRGKCSHEYHSFWMGIISYVVCSTWFCSSMEVIENRTYREFLRCAPGPCWSCRWSDTRSHQRPVVPVRKFPSCNHLPVVSVRPVSPSTEMRLVRWLLVATEEPVCLKLDRYGYN